MTLALRVRSSARTFALLLASLTIVLLCFQAPPARAEIAKPIIQDLSVSHITAHGALLEASYSSVAGLWVHAGFTLHYRSCPRCGSVRDLSFAGALEVASARTLTLRAELVGLPSATRQSFTVTVTAEPPFKPGSRAGTEASPLQPPPRGPIIVEDAGVAHPPSGELETPLVQEVPERASTESTAVSFVTHHSHPRREARRRRSFDLQVTRTVERIASQVHVDFRRAPRAHREAYPIIGTGRRARVVEYTLVSAERQPLGELSLQEIYTVRPKERLHSVFVWEKLKDAAYGFLFEALRVRTSDWLITATGCTCGTLGSPVAISGGDSPLTPIRFEPLVSYASAVLRDLHLRVLPEAFSPSTEPTLWPVGAAAPSAFGGPARRRPRPASPPVETRVTS